MKVEIKKSWNLCGTRYIYMFNIGRETYKGNDIETIVDIDGILLFL